MTVTATDPVRIVSIRAEHRDDALGLGTPTPRLSWQVQAPPGWRQAAWEAQARIGDVTHTARGNGQEQILIDWPFEPLGSRAEVVVRLRVQGAGGDWSDWSAALIVEAGLLQCNDWTAEPVGPSWPEAPGTMRRPALVRRCFTLDGSPDRARLYVSAHGLCEVEINGTRIGDHEFTPGWTSYDKRLLYWTYDVTEHLRPGENMIGAWLADGWYRGRLGFNGGHWDLYGNDMGLIAQLEVTTDDGHVVTIATDESWEAAPSPILSSSLYDGETYDCGQEFAGWSTPEATRHGWAAVKVGHRDPGSLEAPIGPPVRCTQELTPVSITRLGPAKHLLDFGQNLVGRLRIRADGSEGAEVHLRHAEVLENGQLGLRPLRKAAAHDVLILDGKGPRSWEPRFTFHGFRYATVEGLTDLSTEDVVARVISSDMRRTGHLRTSSQELNRLHENVVWSMRGNFLSVPTDCPQRDERLGWTGDIQVFAPTAAFLYDCAGFLDSWLIDVAQEQLDDGTIPWFVPVIPGGPSWTPIETGAVWGDVSVLTPWDLYQSFGDTGLLSRHFDSGQAWVERIIRQAGATRIWRSGHQLGDWLDPSAPPEDPAAGRTDKYLVATAFFAESTRRLSQIALILGRTGDADRYHRIAEEVRDAFRAEFVVDGGLLTSDAPTAYALAIQFDLLSISEMEIAGARLVRLVQEADHRIATGFAGTHVISEALSKVGRLDVAYRLLLEQGCPSWLYAVRMGATTIWERWDSMLPDGSINPGEMTSFNHYALGAVAAWMHRHIGGLQIAAPGYRHLLWAPRPGGGLTSSELSLETPYGRVEASWTQSGSAMTYRLQIPTGVTATVDLPEGEGTRELEPGSELVVTLPHCEEA